MPTATKGKKYLRGGSSQCASSQPRPAPLRPGHLCRLTCPRTAMVFLLAAKAHTGPEMHLAQFPFPFLFLFLFPCEIRTLHTASGVSGTWAPHQRQFQYRNSNRSSISRWAVIMPVHRYTVISGKALLDSGMSLVIADWALYISGERWSKKACLATNMDHTACA